MKLFIYESLCAGGLGDQPPASLRAEGWAMLSAVAADFASVAETSVLLTAPVPEIPGVRCGRTTSAEEPHRFLDAIDGCDAVLLIAPEFDDILGCRAAQVLASGKRLLGCAPDAIRSAADKWTLAQYWGNRPEAASGGPTPPARRVAQQLDVPTPATSLATRRLPTNFPAILKPRDGAGSQATRLIASAAAWESQFDAVISEMPGRDFIVQPFHAGLACSVAFLVGSRQTLSLAPTEQLLSTDGHFQYLGGRLPLSPEQAGRAIDLAARALDGIAGLAGFVGVDLILGDDGNDVAIEINPRLTTSYIGLRALCRENLAEAWLSVLAGERDVELTWKPGSIAFFADGRLTK